MIARIVVIVTIIYLVLVTAGVAVVWLLSSSIGFFGGLAAAGAGFALLAWGVIRVIAHRLKGVTAMVRAMQMQGAGGMQGARPTGPTIDAEALNRDPERPA